MRSKIFFLHIPKTAGTSLRGFLENFFHHSRTSDAWFPDALLKMPPWMVTDIDIIAGHYPASILKWLPSEQYLKLTFLRDPIARSISHFNHLKMNESAFMHTSAKDCDLETFLNRADGLFELANIQTMYLGGEDLNSDYFLDKTVVSAESAASRIAGPIVQKAYQNAISFLESCEVVGIVERMNDSMLSIADKFVLPSAISIGHANRGELQTPPVSERLFKRLQEINQYDLKLYDEAQRILSKRIDKITTENIENTYRAHFASTPRIRDWHYTPEDAALCYGWHGRELLENGVYARWTATERAYIDVPSFLPASFYTISFRVGFYTQEQMESFQFTINGKQVLVDSVRCDENNKFELIYKCRVIGKQLHNPDKYIRLGWEVDVLVNPARQFGARDSRDLGVYLWWCSINNENRILR